MLKKEIIEKGYELFHGKYNYSLLGDIKTKKEKFPVICPEHGIFYKTYESHIRRAQGCPECSGKKRYTNEEFIEKCKALEHTQELSFDKCQYINNKTKITLYCYHKDDTGHEHGEFEITPGHLLSGEGCPKCRYLKSAANKRRTIEEVIAIANNVHNNKYDYSLITEYKNDKIKYPIICPEHDVFYQAMNNHIKGKQGCPVCGRLKSDKKRTYTTETYIQACTDVHNGKYDYSLVNYSKSDDYVDIICPEHGIFKQIARNHLYGQGCPKCYKEKSGVERELYEYIKELLPNVIIEENNRTILDGKEIDVYIPSLKIGFEMNGLIWHSDKFDTDKTYHLAKTEKALNEGIRLIHIFEDEWVCKNTICKSRICNLLGVIDTKIYARKCEIREVSYHDAMRFLDENHIQGKAMSSINIGLYYNNELVELVTFGKQRINVGGKKKDNSYELIRLCTKLDTNVVGGASRLFKYFVKNYNPHTVISYADRRWSVGGIYNKLNFVLKHTSQPSYFYVMNKKRVNRYSMRKDILVSKYGCPIDMTEKEFCYSKGWYRIYDCGCLCYEWIKN